MYVRHAVHVCECVCGTLCGQGGVFCTPSTVGALDDTHARGLQVDLKELYRQQMYASTVAAALEQLCNDRVEVCAALRTRAPARSSTSSL